MSNRQPWSASVKTDASAYSGLGLGLTICRGIADSHGASLNFKAEPKGGVTATFTISAADLGSKDHD